MKKLSFILMCLIFLFSALPSFAQSNKKTIDRIGSWRNDMACGMELNALIRYKKDNAVATLQSCCKKHSSACLDAYSGPDNKTLLYTAIEAKAYLVAKFLLNLSRNYIQNIDAFGKTIDTIKENDYFFTKTTKEDNTSMTPLMLACSNGDLQGSALLITYGASLLKYNFKTTGQQNKRAYDYAKEAKYKDMGFMEYIEKEYKHQINDLFGHSNIDAVKPLHYNLQDANKETIFYAGDIPLFSNKHSADKKDLKFL